MEGAEVEAEAGAGAEAEAEAEAGAEAVVDLRLGQAFGQWAVGGGQ